MKYTLTVAMLAATLSFGACGNAQNATEHTETTAEAISQDVDAAAFKSMMEQQPGTVLDVRTPAEVADGVIPNAVHINIQDSDFAERTAQLDKSKPVYVYCKAGGRSARAAKTLESQGFSTVINLDGGITGWNAAGFETATLAK